MTTTLADARELYRAALRHCRVAHVLGKISQDEAKALLIPLRAAVKAAEPVPAAQLEMFQAPIRYHRERRTDRWTTTPDQSAQP